MPELPDLELFAENLRGRILDKKIEEFGVERPQKVRNLLEGVTPVGSKIKSITREGKELVFHLEPGPSFSVHLMLNGKFFLMKRSEFERKKGQIFWLSFGDEVFGVHDFQGQANANFAFKPSPVPDALSSDFTLDYWLKVAKHKANERIKSVLVDQKLVKGIGGAYADEILYEAKVAPLSRTGSIPEEQLEAIYSATAKVLKWAMKELHRLTPDAIAGETRSFLKVHRRDLKVTETGAPIKADPLDGRNAYYTDEQVLYR